MAEAWLATATGPGAFRKRVVLKTIAPHRESDGAFVDMFIREAAMAAKLDHHNIVQVFDFGVQDQTHFIAMEYVPGRSLSRIARRSARRRSPLPFSFILGALTSVCRGLAHAHTLRDDDGSVRGIVHRDVTPENVIVSFLGVTKVLDFGIAAPMGDRSDVGLVKGKVAYIAPEQLRGRPATERSDVYSVGVLLYELCSGIKPFASQGGADLLVKIAKEGIPSIDEVAPALPAALRRLIRETISLNPVNRPASAETLRRELIRVGQEIGCEPFPPDSMSHVLCELFSDADDLPAHLRATLEVDEPVKTGLRARQTRSEPPPIEITLEDQTDNVTSDTASVFDRWGATTTATGRTSDIFASRPSSERSIFSSSVPPAPTSSDSTGPRDTADIFSRRDDAEVRRWPDWATTSRRPPPREQASDEVNDSNPTTEDPWQTKRQT